MAHDITIEGDKYRLRPVRVSDADFILSVRQEPIRKTFLQAGSQTVAQQEDWLRGYMQKNDDYYFIIETIADGSPQGTIALYNFDHTAKSAEWGRIVMVPGSPASHEAMYLIHEVGFKHVGLDQVYSWTNADNARALALYPPCGIPRLGEREEPLMLNGEMQTARTIQHGCTKEAWPDHGIRLLAFAGERARVRALRDAQLKAE